MNVSKTFLIIGLCLMTLGACIRLFIHNTPQHIQYKETKSFAIDSVDYHRAGRDNTLQVTPYWKCHLEGTNVWVRVTENKEVGDSLCMIIK
jgi:hypothetical protein